MHNKVWQKKIAVFLVIAMVLFFMPLAWANPEDAMAGGAGGSTTASSPSALQWSDDTVAVMDSTTYSSLQMAIDAVPKNSDATITIVKDMETTGITVQSGRKIVLQSDGAHTIKFSNLDITTDCFKVNGSGSELTLCGNLTVELQSDISAKDIIGVYGGATAILNDGVTLKTESNVAQAIVYACGSSSYKMRGGTIDGKELAEGVRVINNAQFLMTGGTITDCSRNDGSGVHVEADASFTMTGGTISNCAGTNGAGVYVTRVIWGNEDATGTASFLMSGGTISGCEGTNGAGVYVEAPIKVEQTKALFKMEDGLISNCTASGNGGGVYLKGNTIFEMYGGGISACTANGGGDAETKGLTDLMAAGVSSTMQPAVVFYIEEREIIGKTTAILQRNDRL